jgi:hypothetical protein
VKTLIERLREEADDTHKNWYRVASDEQREQCRALTLESADRIVELAAELAQFKELAEVQAKSAEAGWNRVRALEAALHKMLETYGPYPDYHEIARAALATTETFDVTKEPSLAMKNEMRKILGLEPLKPETKGDANG